VDFDSRGVIGRFEDRLELSFLDGSLHRQFAITRNIIAIVGSREDYEAIKPVAPYVPRIRKAAVAVKDLSVEKGPKPRALADVRWVVELLMYHVPLRIENLVNSTKRGKDLVQNIQRLCLPKSLDGATYTRFFMTLLHVEEAQLR
jgi:helicase MOV-10